MRPGPLPVVQVAERCSQLVVHRTPRCKSKPRSRARCSLSRPSLQRPVPPSVQKVRRTSLALSKTLSKTLMDLVLKATPESLVGCRPRVLAPSEEDENREDRKRDIVCEL